MIERQFGHYLNFFGHCSTNLVTNISDWRKFDRHNWQLKATRNWWPNFLSNARKNMGNDQIFSIIGSMPNLDQMIKKKLGDSQEISSARNVIQADWKYSITNWGNQKPAIKNVRSSIPCDWIHFRSLILWWPELFSIAMHNGGNSSVIKKFLVSILMDMMDTSRWTPMWHQMQNGRIMSILTTMMQGNKWNFQLLSYTFSNCSSY